MKKNNQSIGRKVSVVRKIIIFIILLITAISIYVASTSKKSKSTFSSALYSGKSISSGKGHQPPKLKWFDGFNGVNNMGK
jgi:hypothetical protein